MRCRLRIFWLVGSEMLNGASFAVSELRPTALDRTHPATRLAGLILALASGMVADPVGLVVLLVLVVLALVWTGLGLGRQLAALRPWLPVAALVMVVHTLTTVAAAPLGHPSVAGVWAGLRALSRVATSVALLGLYLRIASLDDLIVGVGWWLSPLRRLGLAVDDLGLTLAVALGTAPVVLGEGRRIEMVVRLRRSGTNGAMGGWLKRWTQRIIDRARLVVPLLETLGRRAEALSLSLRRRRPTTSGGDRFLPFGQSVVLVAWTGLLVWTAWW